MTAGPDRTTAGSPPVRPLPAPGATSQPGLAASGESGAPAPGGPTAERPFGRPVPTEGWGWFARVPLRARLVAITVLLLAAGLGLASAVTTTVVSNYLVRQVDAQLERSAAAVANITLNERVGASSQLPSDYFVLVRPTNGEEVRCAGRRPCRCTECPRSPRCPTPRSRQASASRSP